MKLKILKKTKSAACFVFATTNKQTKNQLDLDPAPALKNHCCACQWAQELQNRNRWSKNWMKKNRFVWMFRIDLKKQTNYCDKKQKENKKQFTQNQSDSKCHCGVLTRKIKRPVTIALPYPPPLHQKWRKTKNQITKKITNRNRKQSFSCFFNNTYKRTNFSVFDDHIYARHFKTFKEKNGCLKTGKKTRPYITHLHNNDEKSRPLILRRRCD